MSDHDNVRNLLTQRHPAYVRVTAERLFKMQSRAVMDEYIALGGDTMESLGIHPDTPLKQAHTQLIRAWAASPDGIMGYLAQWGLLDHEISVVNHVKVYVDGETAWEGEVT